MEKWEYRVIWIETGYDRSGAEIILNELGEEGWEVCAAIADENGTGGVILKRKKR